MEKYYAGIGSRGTPLVWLTWFTALATRLEAKGYTLRSGGANGADSAFEAGVVHGKKDIFLPWQGFNNNQSQYFMIDEHALNMAKEYHPRWNSLKPAGKKFMARNCYQVLGYLLSHPSDFIVCWTPDGLIKGGTGQALRIAAALDIPVFNFGGPNPNAVKQELVSLVQGEK